MVTTKKVVKVKETPAPAPITYCDTVLNGIGYQTSDDYTSEDYDHEEGGKEITFGIFMGIACVFLLGTLYGAYYQRGIFNVFVCFGTILTLISLGYSIYNKMSMGKIPASWVSGECEIKEEE